MVLKIGGASIGNIFETDAFKGQVFSFFTHGKVGNASFQAKICKRLEKQLNLKFLMH